MHYWRWREFDRPADVWISISYLPVLLVAEDEGEGLIAALGPGLEANYPAPGGPDYSHGHLAITGFAPEILIGSADEVGADGAWAARKTNPATGSIA